MTVSSRMSTTDSIEKLVSHGILCYSRFRVKNEAKGKTRLGKFIFQNHSYVIR